jgi:hypothetical protein
MKRMDRVIMGKRDAGCDEMDGWDKTREDGVHDVAMHGMGIKEGTKEACIVSCMMVGERKGEKKRGDRRENSK